MNFHSTSVKPTNTVAQADGFFHAADDSPTDALWLSGLSETFASGLCASWSGGEPVSPHATASRTFQLLVKRQIDLTIAALALFVLSPLFACVALAIKLESKGPVFFVQQREGLDGKLFWALKFRSMRSDQSDLSGVNQTVAGDSRVTAIGRFLRKTSIDELPQLINVLKGEMSLVGPRPHVPNMLAAGLPYRRLIPYYDARLAMLPGITGWAQANGLRGSTVDPFAAKARVDHDIAYVQNFSVRLDLQILAKTVIREFLTGSGH